MLKHCKYCNKDFSSLKNVKTRKCCGSVECKKKLKHERSKKLYDEAEMVLIECPYCNTKKTVKKIFADRSKCRKKDCVEMRKKDNPMLSTLDMPQEESKSALEIQFPYFFSLVKKREPRKIRSCIRCYKEFLGTRGNRICAECAIINERVGELCYHVL